MELRRGLIFYFQFKSHELHQDHLAIAKSTPLDCKSFSKLKIVKMLPDQIRPSNNLCFSWWLWLITLSWEKVLAKSFYFFLLFPNMRVDLERCELIFASMYHLWWLGGISEEENIIPKGYGTVTRLQSECRTKIGTENQHFSKTKKRRLSESGTPSCGLFKPPMEGPDELMASLLRT